MNVNMKAVILAGGKGTRLGKVTSEIPKPMIRLGDKPLLLYQIELLLKYNIRDIILLVNYLKDPIIEYFGDGTRFDANITYYEELSPLGTTGGIKEIENQLNEDFLVLYGDVLIDMDLSRLIGFHKSRKSECTLVLHPNDHPYDSDLVEINDEARVIAFHSKPHPEGAWYHNMVNAGAYVLSPRVLDFIEKGKKADFGRDIFPFVCEQLAMYGYHTSEYLKDMGTPDRLEKVNRDLSSGRVARSSYEFMQPAIFLDRDGVINTERSFISRPEDLEIFDNTPAAIRKINQAGFLSIVVTNQSAVARNLCTEEDVRTIHKKMETVLGNQGAWLDAIYYCPHHPDKGFPEENATYKIVCDCRKPGTGMFKKAIEKFNIDPSVSFMIGDSERDIQAGINAGCTTVGVMTGYGIKKTRVLPDYMFADLTEAVNFIIDDPFAKVYADIHALFKSYTDPLPWIILIGGNARSGKSTLASYLRIAFKRDGRRVLQVSLDNWILPEEQRTAGMDVYNRFQLPVIENDIISMLSGRKITVHSYANHPERKSIPLEYDPANAEIIILEGVVALSSETIRNSANLKLFVKADPVTFTDRIHEYYSWRGKTIEETSDLIKKRELDEYQLIEKESKLADLIINATGL
jgi:D,D-heptose 1,7-bisphosphate phosphatase